MIDFLAEKKHIHFIGAGGSGMFPLAQILLAKGYELTGSDNNDTDTLWAAEKAGMRVFLGHSAENLGDADVVIYSAAIKEDNVERVAARVHGIPEHERAELLGLISGKYGNAICVSGTHGKTTASAMITHILLADDRDISAVIGGKLPLLGGSGKVGTGEEIVIEACEFNDTFLSLSPTTTLILNIDEDHMDYFKNMENLRQSFTKFVNMTKQALIFNGDDENTRKAVENSDFSGKKYTFGWKKVNDFYPANIAQCEPFLTKFTLMHNNEPFADLQLHVPGKHNVLNAVAAAATAHACDVRAKAIFDGLNAFFGVNRRFECVYLDENITIIDDYAHHPAEITATLQTAKSVGCKRIVAVHQPFTFSRTHALLDEFSASLSLADVVILSEIMGGREENTDGISSSQLAEKIPGATVFPDFEAITEHVTAIARPGDLIITLGCGDINKAAKMMKERLQSQKKE